MSYIGLIIIAVGALLQSFSCVPISKIKGWSWESYWIVHGLFAWILFPLIGVLLAIPEGNTLFDLFSIFAADSRTTVLTIFMGVLWGVGGLAYALSLRYLGVEAGHSFSLGICAILGTLLTPVITGNTEDLVLPVIVGVVISFVGILVICLAGEMKHKLMMNTECEASNGEFSVSKGVMASLVCGFMSACFFIGLGCGEDLKFENTNTMYSMLPSLMLIGFGGFLTNLVFCFCQNSADNTWDEYKDVELWKTNAPLCAVIGLLWYIQFLGLSVGRGLLSETPTLLTLSWSILMALSVIFTNVRGVFLHEWMCCNRKTMLVLFLGVLILLASIIVPILI